jgi:FtsP/CotA-like multicopper oxidase with cupredoxin domain
MMPGAIVKTKLNRRSVLTLSGAALTLTAWGRKSSASEVQKVAATSRVLEVNGKAAKVLGLEVNGRSGGLTTLYGDPFAVDVHNQLAEPTLIHWHGLAPPSQFDGVPMLSAPPLEPGQSAEYRFENRRTGTHWMHSHLGLQEQLLLAAPLIVKEAGEPLVDEQEHVVMLHDFTFRDPAEILSELQGGGGLHAGHGMAMSGGGHAGHGAAGSMNMAGMVNDVAFDAMLANDRTVEDPEVVKSEKAGRFRLRIINGAAATNFWIDLGEITGELIAVDGNAIYPVKGSVFPLAIAQRADIRLSLPPGSGAWPILFRAEGTQQLAAIVLAAGEATVAKIAPAELPADMLDLSLESSLKAVPEGPNNPVARTEMVMLTGGGPDYLWGLNGKPSMHDIIFKIKEGERYEVMMHNMTSMAHPMHLHGHYFRIVAIDGKRFRGALRDTVLVPPAAAVTIQFDADNPGSWAFHCHHLYHMNAGMMAAIAYEA